MWVVCSLYVASGLRHEVCGLKFADWGNLRVQRQRRNRGGQDQRHLSERSDEEACVVCVCSAGAAAYLEHLLRDQCVIIGIINHIFKSINDTVTITTSATAITISTTIAITSTAAITITITITITIAISITTIPEPATPAAQTQRTSEFYACSREIRESSKYRKPKNKT
jgi:hypothetical protein